MSISKLKKRLSGDHDFNGHTIIGSMCTEPHKIAVKTFKRFLSTNIGDPGLFPKLIELEAEYISSLGQLLSNPVAMGSVVSGGSEANILALWTARNRTDNSRREVIISETCHFSFDKAADLLGLDLIKIPVGDDYKIKVDLVEQAISDKTMAIVGIAGTTGLGICDPISDLSDLAVKHNIYLHVDAAFGGFVLPFIQNSTVFDFSLPGVMSVTMDPHKMGRAVIQSGCIIYRNKDVAESINIKVRYLSGGRSVNRTLLGTRSGASVAAAWMVFHSLGFEGYKKTVDKAMELTWWFADQIKAIDGLGIKVEPECNIIGLYCTGDIDNKELLSLIRKKGWAVSEWSDYIRITMMPHVTKKSLNKFLVDLRILVLSLQS